MYQKFLIHIFFKMHQKFLISFKNKQQMHIVRHTLKNNLGSWQPAALESEYLGKQSRQLSLCL